jgi:hypothetical protein
MSEQRYGPWLDDGRVVFRQHEETGRTWEMTAEYANALEKRAAAAGTLMAALERAAAGDSHAEAIAEETHCPGCRASLEFEKHRAGCYLVDALEAARVAGVEPV